MAYVSGTQVSIYRAAFVVLMWFVFGLIAWLAVYLPFIDTKPPYVAKSVKVMDVHGNDATHFKPGDIMLVKRENCGNREVLLYFSRKLVRVEDNFTYVLLDGGSYLVELGCRVTINNPQIPVFVEPGRYRYSVSARFSNNPFQSGTITLVPFEIDIGPSP